MQVFDHFEGDHQVEGGRPEGERRARALQERHPGEIVALAGGGDGVSGNVHADDGRRDSRQFGGPVARPAAGVEHPLLRDRRAAKA